jgi:hypothetical protein
MTSAAAKMAMDRIAKSTSIKQVSDLLRFGFEFEYNSYEGNGHESEIDMDAAREAFNDNFVPFDEADNELRRMAFDIAMGYGNQRQFDRYMEEFESNCFDNFLENNGDDYRSNESCIDMLRDEIRRSGLSDLLESGSDSSVDGGEIRTKDGLTCSQFVKAAKFISNRRDSFSVDTGCSFHIHISVLGITHQYSYKIQAEMMLHLLSNEEFVKDGAINDRLKSSSYGYFKLVSCNDKYTAVHFHSQGTWEFRLFGNIKTKEEFINGMLSAYRAIRHAYRVRLKLSDPLCSAAGNDDVNRLLHATLNNPDHAISVAKAKKLTNTDLDLGA